MLNGRLYNLSNIVGPFRGCLNSKRRQGTFRYMLIEVCESLIRAFVVEAINLLVTIRTVKNQHDKPRLTRPSIQLIASIIRLMIQEKTTPAIAITTTTTTIQVCIE
jgi:hypothetical protein